MFSSLLIFLSWIYFISLITLFISPFFRFCSENWFNLWISLEINIISFIFISLYPTNNLNINRIIKYFIIQTISSSILFFTIILTKNILTFEIISLIIPLSISLKLGLSPFHFWLVDVREGLNWINFFIFNTWQKIIPLFILTYFPYNFYLIIILSSFIGSFLIFNQTSIRKILIFSRLIHISWILIIIPIHSFFLNLLSNFLFLLIFRNINFNKN